MGAARPSIRIAVISPAANAAEAALWRDRIDAAIPHASVALLAVESLMEPNGAPVHLDVEVAVLFAPDAQGEADADVDISEDTGRPYISRWVAVCTNRNCPEPPDS